MLTTSKQIPISPCWLRHALRHIGAGLAFTLACATCIGNTEEEPPPDATPTLIEEASPAETFFIVERAGTLTLDPAWLAEAPAEERQQFEQSLLQLNEDILRGKIAPFVAGDERLKATAGTQSAWWCYCNDNCCNATRMCCQSGIGPFCWSFGTC
ncbi:uncharacterized protein CMC5_083490 [Chondromyces crocatus]|uniref:Uncharacterized protein n=1 Tax=Chondromyces crocatus TaxID=52 RepID=A0A0K1ETK1_CHOCO|nr:uncharacterized protein CMC5_083490 [Chondromyces crocatus]